MGSAIAVLASLRLNNQSERIMDDKKRLYRAIIWKNGKDQPGERGERTVFSGFVSLLRTRAITALRCVFVKTSMFNAAGQVLFVLDGIPRMAVTLFRQPL